MKIWAEYMKVRRAGKRIVEAENAYYKKNDPMPFIRAFILINIMAVVLCSCAFAATASWYGTTGDTCDNWKHTTTANGEKFNENALTAASWQYPLGTKVKVTNLKNGRSVIVRINDRGPGKRLFKKGRIIDLSRGSFMRIASLNEGIIPVSVSLIK